MNSVFIVVRRQSITDIVKSELTITDSVGDSSDGSSEIRIVRGGHVPYNGTQTKRDLKKTLSMQA